METLKFGFIMFKKYFRHALFAFFLGVIVVGITLFLPQISKFIIDYVLNYTNTGTASSDFFSNLIMNGTFGDVGSSQLLSSLCLIFVGLVIIKAIIQYGRNMYMNYYGNIYNKEIRTSGIKKLMQTYDVKSSGELYMVLSSDVYYLKELFINIIPQFFIFLILIILSLVLVFSVHYVIGLVLLGSLPIFIFITIKYIFGVSKYFANSRADSASLSLEVQEGANGIKDIKNFNYEEREIDQLQEKNQKYLKNRLEEVKFSNRYKLGIMITRAIFYAIIVFVSGYYAFYSEISIGGFALVVSYGIMMLDYVTNTIAHAYVARESSIYAINFKNFILSKNKISNNKTKQIINREPNIEATKLCVNVGKNALLKDMSFKIKYGQKIGFFADQGEGKTILSKTLLRLMEFDKGSISINGIDYRELDINSLRNQFSYCPQKPFIFNDSILNNITAFESDEVDLNRFKKILKTLKLEKWIKSLKEKEKTVLKENGAGLPNQESQLMSIARALYRKAPILILDSPAERFNEPDNKVLMNNIYDFARGQTIILLGSDPKIFESLDYIYVLKSGKIAESGTFNELVARNGLFSSELIGEENE